MIAISLFFGVAILGLARLFPRLAGQSHHLGAVQAMHVRATPRLGGVAIFGALALSTLFAPAGVSERYGYFIMATSILFVAGLLEDLGGKVSPRERLLAAMLASLVAIWMLDIWLPRIGVPGLDMFLAHWIVGVPLTLLVTAGVANGFNLIDGVNGLAALTAIVAALALGVIAEQGGDADMGHLTGMLAAGVFGFFLLNYPRGLIFLGDAGAYTLGFVLSWFGIAILIRVPEATPWAILLTMFWPIADMLLAIVRRTRLKAATMAPDRMHMHQLVMRTLEIRFLGRKKRGVANPLTTLVLAPFVVAPPVAGVLLWNSPVLAFAAALLFFALFFTSYYVMVLLVRRFGRRTWGLGARGNPAPSYSRGARGRRGLQTCMPVHTAWKVDIHDYQHVPETTEPSVVGQSADGFQLPSIAMKDTGELLLDYRPGDAKRLGPPR